jgi:hypothetical protein
MQISEDSRTYKQLEATLLAEIESISTQIRELTNQKQSLERVLLRARQQSELVKHSDVTRKNSINRVLVEGAILKSMQNSKRPVRARHLLLDARLMVPTLRENTFRSYLHRMKARGLLASSRTGMWQLPTSKQA